MKMFHVLFLLVLIAIAFSGCCSYNIVHRDGRIAHVVALGKCPPADENGCVTPNIRGLYVSVGRTGRRYSGFKSSPTSSRHKHPTKTCR